MPLSRASTSRILQFWQISWTTCTSSEISNAQPASFLGSGFAWPDWFTFWKHAVATGPPHQGKNGRPNVESNVSRSAFAVGSSNASTIAIVCALGAAVGNEYAPWNCAGPYPFGVVAATAFPAASVTTSAWQRAEPNRGVGQTARADACAFAAPAVDPLRAATPKTREKAPAATIERCRFRMGAPSREQPGDAAG